MPFDFWTWYWGFCSFVFGATVGSFLNVCIWRLPRDENLSHPPSHCPSCNHRLAFLPDMVPLLSQVWYRSKCRYCGTPFSWRYFWVELFTALVFLGCYARYGVFGNSAFSEQDRIVSVLAAMFFAAAMITVFFIDLEHYQIPDSVVLFAVLVAFAKDGYLIWRGLQPLWLDIPGTAFRLPLPLSLLGCLVAFWALWQFAALATAALGREAMGAGDSLLLGAMGAFLLPWPLVLVAFLFAVMLGALGGITGMLLARRAPAAAPERSPAPSDGTEDGSEELPDLFQGHRGALDNGAPEENPGAASEPGEPGEVEVPDLPPGSRWGRLWTVLGTWVAVAALWLGAVLATAGLGLGLGVGLALGLLAFGLLWFGIRQWVRADQAWLPAMDELFEGDPGPRFIPFGPYLVAGTFLAMWFGKPIVEWYAVTFLGLTQEAVNLLPWS